MPQQQGWVGQWQPPPPPQQWAGQGYYGSSNNWNNYQQYYNQNTTATQYNQVEPQPFTHQPYKQTIATKSQQQTQQQYKPLPSNTVNGQLSDVHSSSKYTPQNR